jgi:hypothetical protein
MKVTEVSRPRNVALRPNYTGLRRVLAIQEIAKTLKTLLVELSKARPADYSEILIVTAGRLREAATHLDELAREEAAALEAR